MTPGRDTLPGLDPPSPAAPLRVIVIGPEKAMVVQVLLAIHCWARASCTAICRPGSRHIRHSLLVDRYAEFSFDGRDDERFIRFVNRLEREQPGQLLVPADTHGNRLINRVRQRLHARCAAAPDDAMLDVLDDKWQFHRLCKWLGLRTPQTMFAASKHDIDFDAAARQLGLPFIVKPCSEAQSHGAFLIATREELQRQVLDDDRYQYAPLVVQQFIRGHDVGLNLCAKDGQLKAIAMQRREDPDDDGSAIGFFYDADLDHVAHAICSATGYDGVMNIDGRIEEGTGLVWLFEANPRYWRSLSASVWGGMNFAAENLSEQIVPVAPRMLCTGHANAYHHPLLRPHLWWHALFGLGTQRRLARLLAADICTLMNTLRMKLSPA